MGKITTFEDLKVWQEAHQLALLVCRYSATFPSEERFGITSQIRRASTSVPANIVEGFKRYSQKEKVRFYNIAHASLEEARYFSLLSRDLRFHEAYAEHLDRSDTVGRLLTGLIQATRRTDVVREEPPPYGDMGNIPSSTFHLPLT